MLPLASLAVIALFGVIYAVIARLGLRGYPFSGDEYSSYLQAELFARGLLRAPAPPGASVLLGVDHVVIDEWVRSKYPFGSSALLALGVKAGVPWLVTPLEGVVTLIVVWLTARALLGERRGLVTLVLLGLAPLFAIQAATFYPQTPATMWLACAFGAVAAWTLTKRSAWLLAAGVAIGCAFLTRPFDAVLFALALCALRSPRVLAWVAAGAAPFAAIHLAYQAAQFGSPFRDGYAAYEPTFRAIYGADASQAPLLFSRIWDPVMQWFHLEIIGSFLTQWTVIGTGLLALVGAIALRSDERARPMRDLAVGLIVVTLVTLAPMVTSQGDDGPRPRYLATVLLAVVFLAGAGWDEAAKVLRTHLGDRAARGVAVAVFLFSAAQVGTFAIDRAIKVGQRSGLYDAVEAANVHEGVVVIRARFPTRYARNGPFFDRPVLYLSAPASMDVSAIAERFPARPIYEATEGDPWVVVRRR